MKHGSLFSGIGGFDLAAEWCGWENVFHCEWNTFGQKVLKHHFPKSISYNDITKTDFSIHKGNIDIITGGFPCQPYSTAGLRKGKADERHLFPEMLRAIKEIQPTWVIGENVRGLVSWGGGMVFHEVCDDLEREGYEVQPFIIPAASINAPHKRERIWFIAYSHDKRTSSGSGQIQKKNGEVSEWHDNAEFSNPSNEPHAENPHRQRQEWGVYKRQSENANGQQFSQSNARNMRSSQWENFPTEYPLCNGNDGISERLDGITFSKWRNESIKAGGNAIVPQIAYEIFKTIEKFNNLQQNK